ncbi:MAG: MBOAT family protein [Pseudomonadota bacterium]
MVFSSVPFLFYFLPLLLALYLATPWKNAVLLVMSVLFYAWGEGLYVGVILASIAFNHVFARAIARSAERRRKTFLIAGVLANLSLLGWFKYAGFASFNVAGALGAPDAPWVINPHLPLGISFFTFQALSYLVDVYRKDAEPPRSIFTSALYIALFPQLIAGPIVRYKTIADQLVSRRHGARKFSTGVQLFILGLGQKVLIANVAAGPADQIFALDPSALSAAVAWVGAFSYSIQIFFDFAGYSNMAIGLGLMFGFRFPRNFNYPYAAQSVTEFWRRWHITLSQWFRDYVYIPLGGNRRGALRTYVNLVAVFLLCGLWHGAAWTFVLWGVWHGVFLVVERAGLGAVLSRVWRPLRHVYLLLAVMLGWVLFRAESVGHAGAYYLAMLGANSGEGAYADPRLFVSDGVRDVLLVGILLSTPILERLIRSARMRLPSLIRMQSYNAQWVGLFCLLFVCATFIAGGAYNPFIYFRF